MVTRTTGEQTVERMWSARVKLGTMYIRLPHSYHNNNHLNYNNTYFWYDVMWCSRYNEYQPSPASTIICDSISLYGVALLLLYSWTGSSSSRIKACLYVMLSDICMVYCVAGTAQHILSPGLSWRYSIAVYLTPSLPYIPYIPSIPSIPYNPYIPSIYQTLSHSTSYQPLHLLIRNNNNKNENSNNVIIAIICLMSIWDEGRRSAKPKRVLVHDGYLMFCKIVKFTPDERHTIHIYWPIVAWSVVSWIAHRSALFCYALINAVR